MKKLFLFLFASLLSVSMFAENDGSTKAKAVRYDWSTGIYVSSEANVGKWYVVPLLKEDGGVFNPNGSTKAGKTDDGKTDISISIKNPLDTEVDINCTAYIGDNETNRHFKMAASGSKSMTFGAGMFVRMGINEVYLYLVTDVTVTPQEAEAKEAVNVDVKPVEANSIPFEWIEFNWTDFPAKTAGTTIPANKETWVKFDFANHGVTDGYTYKFYIEKENATPITINAGVSYDCPASSIQEQSQEMKSASTVKVLDEAKLSMIPGTVYIRIKAAQELRIYAEQVEIPAPTGPAIFNIKNGNAGNPAIEVQLYNELDPNTVYTLDADHLVYSVDYATLQAEENYYRQIEVTNNGTEEVTIVGKASKTPDTNGNVYSVATKTVTIPAGQTYTKKIDKTMQSVVGASAGDKIWALGPEFPNVTFKLTQVPVDPEYCKDATNFVWDEWNQQNGGYKWYAVNIHDAKAAKADIILTMETVNQSEEAEITVDIAAACALGEPTQNYTGKSKSTTKTLSYSLFEKNSNDVMYVRVRTDKNIKVMAKLQTTKTWYGTAWSGDGQAPDLTMAARIEGDLTINPGETIKALGLTLTKNDDPAHPYNIITIMNGGKLIIGDEGVKGSNVAEQIVIKEGGIMLIAPNATTNYKPFITAEKELHFGAQPYWQDPSHPADKPDLHEFIALPVADRQENVGVRYFNWGLYAGWDAEPNGFHNIFEGYNVYQTSTHPNYGTFTAKFKGQLVPNDNVSFEALQWGWHACGNSWTAPIQLSDVYGNFVGATADEKAVHLYVAQPTDYSNVELGWIKDNFYLPATADIASNLGITEIKPMQGFFLHTFENGGYRLNVNYSTIYNREAGINTSAPAPKRTVADNRNKVAAVLSDGHFCDFVYMIEGEATNAHKMNSNGLAIYAEDGLAQVANENLIGTILTIQTNEATEYTLHFAWLNGETMYLKDLANDNIIAMTKDTKYTFNAEPNTTAERFQVVGRNYMPTAIENTDAIKGVNKRLENGKVVIFKNGVKYNVLGAQL
jgi:hypothetical protein